jgi:Tripartite tricarboxylate transporter TctB family
MRSTSRARARSPAGRLAGVASDRAAGVALAGFGLAVAAASLSHPLGSLREPGPGFLPLALALLLAGLGLAVAAVGRRGPSLGAVGWHEWRRAAAVLGACAFAAFALERAGYRATVLAVVAFLTAAVERKPVGPSLAVAAALAFGTYVLFADLLRVPLPRGPHGF